MVATQTTKVSSGKVATTKAATSTEDTKVGITLAMAEEIFSRKRAASTRTVGTLKATISSMEVSSRSALTTTTLPTTLVQVGWPATKILMSPK